MQARKRCVLWCYRADLEVLRRPYAVIKFILSRTVLEKLTITGESPLGEKSKSASQYLSKPKHVEFRLKLGRPFSKAKHVR